MKFVAKNLAILAIASSLSLYYFSSPALSQPNQILANNEREQAFEQLIRLSDKYQIKLAISKQQPFKISQADSYKIAESLHQLLQQKPLEQFTIAEQFELSQLKTTYKKELEIYLENLEDDVYANQLEIQQNSFKLKRLSEQFNFRPFGVFALRFCGMAANVLSEPQKFAQNIEGNLLQPRFGGGIRGNFSQDFAFELRALTQTTDNFNNSWFPVGNVDLGRTPISLDRYFIKYQPFKHQTAGFDLNLTFGKALNFLPETELLFDEDVSFNGLSQQIEFRDLMPMWKQLNIGFTENILLSQGPFIRTGLIGANLSTVFQPVDPIKFKLGGSYVHYLGTNHLVKHNFFQGYQGKLSLRNRTFGENQFTSTFNLANSYIKFQSGFANIPIEIIGDLVHNFGSLDKNTGFLVGAKVGQLRNTGDMAFRYNYKVLPQDYNLSLVVQDQMGGTNVSGHEFDYGIKLAKKTNFNIILQTRSSLTEANSDNLYIIYTVLSQRF